MINFNSLTKYEIPKWNESDGFIYFLFYREILVYVGSCWQLEGRIKTHLACKVFDEVKYFTISKEEMYSKEKELIRHYEPILNGEFRCSPENFCLIIEDILFCFHGKLCFKIDGNKLYPASNWGKKAKNNQAVVGYIDSEKCVYEDNTEEYTYYFVENRIYSKPIHDGSEDFMTRQKELFEDVYEFFR